jgi:hypothetical protein
MRLLAPTLQQHVCLYLWYHFAKEF